MQEGDFLAVVQRIIAKDPRYAADAYLFVREALDFTVKTLRKPTEGPQRHVTGQELMDCMRQYALNEFGPMAFTVLNEWGVTRTEDFGDLVFNLVDAGVLGKTETDTREDFAGGYSFAEAFQTPFLPPSKRQPSTPTRRRAVAK
jgi:uncharacterized repeat protein (TIGR04138 family)